MSGLSIRVLAMSACLLAAILLSRPAIAELAAPNARGVAMGHLHYTVRDVEANLRFWTALGGKPVKIGERQAVSFADVIVMLEQGESSGLSHGAVVDHMAFRVKTLEAVAQAGFEMTFYDGYPGVASIYTPDGEMIELFDDTATNLWFKPDAGAIDAVSDRHNHPLSVPIASHHLHLYVPEPDVLKARDWYVTHFGAVPGKRWNYDAADLPGINLNFSKPKTEGAMAPTKGRLMDHIGFEVKNLDAFCNGLKEEGINCEAAAIVLPNGIRGAGLTDPWGTTIELTEGLDKLP